MGSSPPVPIPLGPGVEDQAVVASLYGSQKNHKRALNIKFGRNCRQYHSVYVVSTYISYKLLSCQPRVTVT